MLYSLSFSFDILWLGWGRGVVWHYCIS